MASRRIAGTVLAVGLIVAGVIIGLYGLFAILYSGDSHDTGNSYVKFGGHEIDADLVGAVALVLACLVTFAAVVALRVSRRSVR